MNDSTDNSKESKDKNIISNSEINAGNNIHIGDIIYSNEPKVVERKSRLNYIKYLYFIFFVSLISLIFILVSKQFLQKKELTLSNPAISGADLEKQKDNLNKNNSRVVGNTDKTKSDLSVMQPDSLSISDNKQKDAILDMRGSVIKLSNKINGENITVSKYEVSIEQYYTFCKLTGRSFPHNQIDTLRKKYPMTHISWYDATAYCEYVGGHLPTIEEWTAVALSITGPDSTLTKEEKLNLSWNRENSEMNVHCVGSKLNPTDIKISDFFGNIEEWCAEGPKNGLKYTLGGFFNSYLKNIDIKNRDISRASIGEETIGFRVFY